MSEYGDAEPWAVLLADGSVDSAMPGGYGPFETSQNIACPCSSALWRSSDVSGVTGSPGWALRARRYSSKPGRENRAQRWIGWLAVFVTEIHISRGMKTIERGPAKARLSTTVTVA